MKSVSTLLLVLLAALAGAAALFSVLIALSLIGIYDAHVGTLYGGSVVAAFLAGRSVWKKRSRADLLQRADAMVAERAQLSAELGRLAEEVSRHSPEEQAWMEWFTRQPPDVQVFIEECATRGVRIHAENLQQALAAARAS